MRDHVRHEGKAATVKALSVLLSLAFFVICMALMARATASEREPMTIAIMPFSAQVSDPGMGGLARGLGDMLVSRLMNVRDLQVVERGHLSDLMAEQAVQASPFIDPATAVNLGRGVGANVVLSGALFEHAGTLRIDARIIRVDTGIIISAVDFSGKSEQWSDVLSRLQDKLVESLGVRLTEFELAGMSDLSKTKAASVAAYGRAADLRDLGMLAEARGELTVALQADPNFELAKQLQDDISQCYAAVKGQEFINNIEKIATFEFALMEWPSCTRGEFGAWHLARFPADEYAERISKGDALGALFLWAMSLTSKNPYEKDMYSLLVPGTGVGNQHSLLDRYRLIGGNSARLFWCDVLSSLSEFTPRSPVTAADIESNLDGIDRTSFRRRCFRNYDSVLATRYDALLANNDMARALACANEYQRLFGDIYERSSTPCPAVDLLKALSDLTTDKRRRDANAAFRRQNEAKWILAEAQIVDRLEVAQRRLIARLVAPASSVDDIATIDLLKGELLRLATAPDDDTRLRCSSLLGNIGAVYDPQLLALLTSTVEKECMKATKTRAFQRAAVLALGAPTNFSAVNMLSRVLSGGATPDVKMAAATALAAIGNDDAVDALARALSVEKIYFVRHWITASSHCVRKPSNASGQDVGP